MGRWFRRLAHKIFYGPMHGKVVTFWEGKKLMIGLKCEVCGMMKGAHESFISKELRRQAQQDAHHE
ncbi:hypothetical protein UFOVP239_40 [uncultured Caudovirales phage]|uniref:Uncharacterized protein n=1 Tax=uncultured Caudovirales phage TaxID=2100421 RepID=A0A6J7WVB8_9CAUD|nr:hypothetical protein UFOVP239_40 [uncultured Caudovirales phage]